MRTLLQNRFWTVLYYAPASLIVLQRGTERAAYLEELIPAFEDLREALQTFDRSTFSLLVDLRRGPLRNDDAFETAIAPYRRELTRGFRRAAILVRSAVGVLQVNRYKRTGEAGPPVFTGELEALEHLSLRRLLPSLAI
jgi:hypothetical protein